MLNFRTKQTSDHTLLLPTILISEEVIARTKGLLLSYSEPNDYHEGIVYWAGKVTPREITILAALTPQAKTTYGSVNVGIVENAQVVAGINKLGLEIIAQVHSHPFDCGEGHSEGDNHMAFMPFEGLLSIVVKDYAIDGLLPLTKTGVHIFHEGKFIRISKEKIESSFKIIPTHVELRK